MNVTTLPELGVTRIELEGSIDGKTAPQIREELSPTLQHSTDSGNERRFVMYLPGKVNANDHVRP